MKEKKDLAILEAFFSLLFFSFFYAVTRAFPLPIKGKPGCPMKGDLDPHETEPRDKNIRAQHEHTVERQASSQHLFTSSNRDLGFSPSLAYL